MLGAARAWESYGAKVFIVLYSEGNVINSKEISVYESDSKDKLGRYYDRSVNNFNRFISIRHQYSFLRKALQYIKPDLVYSRYAMPVPGLSHIFSSMSPYIIEINSDDLIEYSLKSKIIGFYNRILRKQFICAAKGLCFISQELKDSSSFDWYQRDQVVISNSIDCASYQFKEETLNDKVNLCFIGSPHQSWHGLDKVAVMAELFPGWLFHVIGPTRDEFIKEAGEPTHNIVFHGYLNGEKAKEIVGQMDVGISTMALHRIQLNEASPLKSRQYLAQGIPFIAAYKDTDMGEEPFVLSLPNCENNVEPYKKTIESFVLSAYKNCTLRWLARAYANDVLDVGVKEQARLEFMKRVM